MKGRHKASWLAFDLKVRKLLSCFAYFSFSKPILGRVRKKNSSIYYRLLRSLYMADWLAHCSQHSHGRI